MPRSWDAWIVFTVVADVARSRARLKIADRRKWLAHRGTIADLPIGGAFSCPTEWAGRISIRFAVITARRSRWGTVAILPTVPRTEITKSSGCNRALGNRLAVVGLT